MPDAKREWTAAPRNPVQESSPAPHAQASTCKVTALIGEHLVTTVPTVNLLVHLRIFLFGLGLKCLINRMF